MAIVKNKVGIRCSIGAIFQGLATNDGSKWPIYLLSLRDLIETGSGRSYPHDIKTHFGGWLLSLDSTVFQITAPVTDPRKLTQSVLQITAMLDLYQAELARVLKVRCGDIGELSSGQCCLEPGTESWQQAQLFVRFYQALYRSRGGDGVAMRHWLRIDNADLTGVPHLIIVDDGELERVVEYLE